MSSFDAFAFDPASFSGRVRLFPLPNLVLFPHVLQPLHIFEPRYRALFDDAIEDDRLIAMGLLAAGWESDYEGRPPVHPIGCLGRIASHHRLEDGRCNLLLQGIQRVRLVRELPAKKMFREWEATLCDDIYPVELATERAAVQESLVGMFKRALPKLPDSIEQLEHLLASDVSLGTLTDLMAHVLDFDIPFKQRLLGETNTHARAAMLLDRLETPGTDNRKSSTDSTFPPDFSLN
jgi:Lon protease-like protein